VLRSAQSRQVIRRCDIIPDDRHCRSCKGATPAGVNGQKGGQLRDPFPTTDCRLGNASQTTLIIFGDGDGASKPGSPTSEVEAESREVPSHSSAPSSPAPGRLPLPRWPEKTGPWPRPNGPTLGGSVGWRASSFAWGSTTPFSPLPNFPRPTIAEPAAVIFRFARRLRAPPRFLVCFWIRLPLGLAETFWGERSSSCAFLSLRPMVGGKPIWCWWAVGWQMPGRSLGAITGRCLTCAARLRRNRMVAYLLRSNSSCIWVLELCV
jgi:hypothetical protein